MNYYASVGSASKRLHFRLVVSSENPVAPKASLPFGPLTLSTRLLTALIALILAASGAPASAILPEGSDFEVLGPRIEDFSWSPGVAATASEVELEDISAPRKGYIYVPGMSPAFDWALDHLNSLHDSTGIRFGTAYAMLFQGLTHGSGINGEEFPRYGAAGRFDLLGSWTMVGRDTENPGQLVIAADNRFAIGNRSPASLGGHIATLQNTANTFTDRGWALRDFFYEQRLWHGQIRLMLGRADSTEYFASTWMQTAQSSFVNRVFAAPATITAPGNGPAVGMSFRPNNSDFYISGGGANAYGHTTTTGFNTLDQWTFFSYGELGWTPTFSSLGEGRYTVSGWHIGERTQTGLPADWGLTAVADQQLCSKVEAFVRYGYSEAVTLRIRHYAQAGLGWRGLIGSTNDMTGLAFSWQSPRRDLRDEKVVETFYRAQVTRFMQLSVGAQAIFDPGQSTTEVVGAFWGRVRIFF